MAIAIIQDKYNDHAVLFCNTTDWAFGPVHSSEHETASEELELFLDVLVKDARLYSTHQLEILHRGFCQQLKRCACGEPFLGDTFAECPECRELDKCAD